MSNQKTVNSKQVLKDLADKKVKIKFNDRIKLVILEDTKFYVKGQEINPHRTFGEALITKKIAKEI